MSLRLRLIIPNAVLLGVTIAIFGYAFSKLMSQEKLLEQALITQQNAFASVRDLIRIREERIVSLLSAQTQPIELIRKKTKQIDSEVDQIIDQIRGLLKSEEGTLLIQAVQSSDLVARKSRDDFLATLEKSGSAFSVDREEAWLSSLKKVSYDLQSLQTCISNDLAQAIQNLILLHREIMQALTLLCIATGILAIASWFSVKYHVIDRIVKLTSQMHTREHLRPLQSFELLKQDEINQLSEKFHKLQSELNERIADLEVRRDQLKESEENFRLLSNAVPQMVWTANNKGEILYSNEQSQVYSGIYIDHMPYKDWPNMIHPDDLQVANIAWQEAIVSGSMFEVEQRLRSIDGSYRWFLCRAIPMKNKDGDIIRWIGTNTDIDERQKFTEKLEQIVNERTAQLRDANQELESFSYSISHDLRAPLRVIDGFSDVLLQRFHSQFSPDASNYLRRVKDAAHRMSKLIDDMLRLSHLTRKELRFEEIDFSELAHSVVEELKVIDKNRCVDISIADGIKVTGDKNLLRCVLENLIGNAWKFTRKSVHPKIVIGAAMSTDEKAYFVQDNGVGFDMAFKDRLFQSFQRLHSTEEFEGTGIGLASVQRIIRRHHGKIWAQSSLNEGAIFYFTLGDEATKTNTHL